MSTLRTVVTNPAAAYTAQNAPVVSPGFEANYSLINLDSGDGATISFDGINDDLVLVAGGLTTVPLPLKLSKVWIKAAGNAVVSVWQSSDSTYR